MRSQAQDRTSEESGYEKRVFSRVRCLVDLEVTANTKVPTQVEAVDLSLLGVGLKIKRPTTDIKIGDQVVVGMHGLKPIKGQVRWNSGPRLGVQFRGRFHDIVDSWVGEVLAAQGVTIKDLIQAPS